MSSALAGVIRKLFGQHCKVSLKNGAFDDDAGATRFHVDLSSQRLFGGWYRMTFRPASKTPPAVPVLNVDHGADKQVSEIPLGLSENSPLSATARIHGPIKGLTLSLRASGKAPAPTLAIRNIGLPELLFRVLTRDPFALAGAARHLFQGRPASAKTRIRDVFELPRPEPAEQYRIWRLINEGPAIAPDDATSTVPTLSRIAAVIDARNLSSITYLQQAIGSLRDQIHHDWRLVAAIDENTPQSVLDHLAAIARDDDRVVAPVRKELAEDGPFAAALSRVDADYVFLISPGDLLPEDALTRLSQAIERADRRPVMVYADSDHIDRNGIRHDPDFKPALNPELLLSRDYIARPCLFEVAWLRSTGGFDDQRTNHPDYLAKLRAGEQGPVLHLPTVLCHRIDAADPQVEQDRTAQRIAILKEFLAQTGCDAHVEEQEFGNARIAITLPARPPAVTLIVPTRDQLQLTRQCVDGVLSQTDYADVDLILVNNDSREAGTLAWLDEIADHPRVTRLDWPGAFNYSAMNNDAVAIARGSVVGLLNNDIEILHPDWLTEMVSHAIRPSIGAVGAKLLYPDGRIQHAGIITGIGSVAGHGHKLFDGNSPGYQGRLQATRNVAAVTGACLVVAREKYEAVGGLDAKNLAVAFNDVDLCLKLSERGWRNLYTPYARLVHHESVSRGADLQGEKAERFRREAQFMRDKWRFDAHPDVHYSPHLSKRREDFSLEIGF